MQPTNETRRHHAVIAGTGRAGTTFLVRFLSECGVPAGDLESLGYSPEARAGFECSLLDAGDAYLVKDPWLSEYLDEIDLDRISIDVLILPVRDLREAANSRVRREIEHWQSHPGFTPHRRLWGNVSGGVVYSLSVADQERILAAHQAKVLEWALRHDITLIPLHFPRLVNDGDYLIDALWPWLGRFCDRATARVAFDAIADPGDVTVPISRTPVSADGIGDDDGSAQLLAEVAALRSVNQRLMSEAAIAGSEARRAREEAELHRAEALAEQKRVARLRTRLEETTSSTTYRIGRFLVAPVGLMRGPFSRRTRRSTDPRADGRPDTTRASRGI